MTGFHPTYPDSVGVDQGPDNDIRLTIWSDVVAGRATKVILSLDQALGLMRDLASQVSYAVPSVVTAIKAGDCPTCRNLRLVEVPGAPRGRSNERCPDCGPGWNAAREDTFARPRVGGGTR